MLHPFRLIRRIILAIVLLIVIAVVVVFYSLDRIIRSTVQSQASSSLNLTTTLDSASLSLFGGKLDLKQLDIGSPKGFSAPHMLELGDTNVAVNYSQLRGEPIHVASLTLDKPKLVIEQSNGTLNFKKAMDDMPPGDTTPKDQSKPIKLIIDELKVNDAQVVIRPGLPGMSNEITVPVASISLKNVGTGDGSQNGAAIKDVAMQVITALAGSASGSGSIPNELKGLLNANLGQVISKFGADAQQRIAAAIPGDVGKALSQAVKDPQTLLKDPSKALQGLLGGNNGGASTQPADVKDKAVNALEGLLGGNKQKK